MTTFDLYRLEHVWLAWGRANVFLLPILLVLALLAWRRPTNKRGALFLVSAILVMFVWRVWYAWVMRGGIRYQALPVILSIPLAISGLYVARRFFSSRVFAGVMALLILTALVGGGIAKNCRYPKNDKKPLVAAVVSALRAEKTNGILLDDSSAASRLRRELPEFEFVFEHHLQPDDNKFWRNLLDFIRKRQVEQKKMYILLQTPRNGNGLQEFRDAALREWGMTPFTTLCRHGDNKSRYELLRYDPPSRLFGLNVSTPAKPNPDGPFLPSEIMIRRGEPYKLAFTRIMTDARYFQWGGVEVDVRLGVADDFSWQFTPDAKTPERFPLEITLYAPNGWPTGYAATTIRVVDQPVALLPEQTVIAREIDWNTKPEAWERCLPVPPEVLGAAETPSQLQLHFDELCNIPGDRGDKIEVPQARPLAEKPLEKPIFWIGSRIWGTPWITERLKKSNPKLEIYRLEDHPRLPYSKDPRYGFYSLSVPRKPCNPLLNEQGKVDWSGYLRRQKLPPFSTVVIALGYEEITWWITRSAFHIDRATKFLRTFLDAVKKDAPECRVLLIPPGVPSLLQKDYSRNTANPSIYGFRWVRRHAYKRLVEASYQVAREYPQVTVLPTYLWLHSGRSERDPLYQKIIQLYLQDLENKSGQHENTIHPQ